MRNYRLERIIEELIEELIQEYYRQHRSELVWEALVLDGNFSLITTLHYAEMKTPGFGTIVTPVEGFSQNDKIHNLVISWCHEHDIATLSVLGEIAYLENACTWRETTIF
jgi:hypothetical protein